MYFSPAPSSPRYSGQRRDGHADVLEDAWRSSGRIVAYSERGRLDVLLAGTSPNSPPRFSFRKSAYAQCGSCRSCARGHHGSSLRLLDGWHPTGVLDRRAGNGSSPRKTDVSRARGSSTGRNVTDLERSPAALRAALRVAAKRIHKLNFGRRDDPMLSLLRRVWRARRRRPFQATRRETSRNGTRRRQARLARLS